MTTTQNEFPQCRTCNLDEALQDELALRRSNGETLDSLSTYVNTYHYKRISPDALSNHLRKHAGVFAPPVPSAPTVAPLLGVVKPPKGWEARAEVQGDSGQITSTPQSEEVKDFSKILAEFGTEFADFEIDGEPRISKWQSREGGEWLSAYKFSVKRKNPESFDMPTLFQEVKASLRFKEYTKPERVSTRTVVVPFADLQAGKVGSRGDSKDLIERVTEKRYRLEEYVTKQNCEEAVFLDGGDVVESFENTAQQGFTNDLSIMDQLDLAGTLEQDFISMLSQHHSKVTVAGVPSNHGAWRKGKDILGRPSDDWGLFLLKQIEKAYKLNTEAFGHVEFQYPDEWRKSINIDVQGLGVGLVHGEDSSLAQMENWWAKQVHGASPVAESDILITNHYHTLGLKPTGRSLRTGKQKYWLATPTLDNGSDWWANKSGSDSDPGLMAFVVDSEIGFDLSSFTVL